MPLRVRTPEQIFREEKKDIFFIEFKAVEPLDLEFNEESLFDENEDPPGRGEIIAWLEEKLPHCKTEPLGPSENSG